MSDWYQVENAIFTIQVNTKGAELKRLFVKTWNKEILWLGDKDIWPRSAPVLFPFVGKLKEDSYIYNGEKYQMSQHGFARDLEHECLFCDVDEIKFKLSSSEKTLSKYPFSFELMTHYKLTSNMLTIEYLVKNIGPTTMFFSIGAHPGFSIGNIEDYEIKFEKNEGEYYRLKDGFINFNEKYNLVSNAVLLTNSMMSKDALVFRDVKSHYVDFYNRNHHEVIRVNNINTPYFGIWGKEDKGKVRFICFEPWHGIADLQNHDLNIENKMGINKLLPNKEFRFQYSIEVVNREI